MSAVVAIDGPSGAGKGTVARAVARALDWQYVDTGAMYRVVAWKTQQLGRSLDDEDVVVKVAGTALFEIDENRVMVDGQDVTTAIRTPEIDVAAATVARMPLRNRLSGSEMAVAFTVIVGLALVIPGLIAPVFLRIFVDKYLVAGLRDWIKPLLIGMALTAIVRAALTWLWKPMQRRPWVPMLRSWRT